MGKEVGKEEEETAVEVKAGVEREEEVKVVAREEEAMVEVEKEVAGTVEEALAEVKRFCPLVKWLGSYPVVT